MKGMSMARVRLRSAAIVSAMMAAAGVGVFSGGTAVASPGPEVAAANPCDIGALCVYEDPEFGGKHFEHQGNQTNWVNTLAPSKLLNKDSSWANRYQSWYWACVYDKPNYVNVTVWVARGQYLARGGSGMYPNRGESHHGWNSGATC